MMQTDAIRLGTVSSVHPELAAVRVAFLDQDDMVSEPLPVVSPRGTYSLPKVGDMVLCLFLPSSRSAGFCLGTYFIEDDKIPAANEAIRTVWLESAKIDRSLGLRAAGSSDEYADHNFEIIEGTRDGVKYTEMWILTNAYYDRERKRFCRKNLNNFSFGWQLQAGGTYPGEGAFGDFINQTVGLWKANGRNAYGEGDPMREQTGIDIGRDVDGKWQEFGVMGGWTNVFMCDSYGGMTIGGAGFEIDGNGLSPYKRVSLGKFGGGSTDPNKPYHEYGFAYNGTTWNAFHQLYASDQKGRNSFFWGMVSSIDFYDQGPFNPYSAQASMEDARFVVMMLPKNKDGKAENWETVFQVTHQGDFNIRGKTVPAIITVPADVVNSTDFNMLYPDNTWTKDNTFIVAVKGITADGSVKQNGAINATFTDAGIYGYLGTGFVRAEILISKHR